MFRSCGHTGFEQHNVQTIFDELSVTNMLTPRLVIEPGVTCQINNNVKIAKEPQCMWEATLYVGSLPTICLLVVLAIKTRIEQTILTYKLCTFTFEMASLKWKSQVKYLLYTIRLWWFYYKIVTFQIWDICAMSMSQLKTTVVDKCAVK